MGEVFRATDMRLRRTVAIKVLPHDRVADPGRRRRFLQEARAASALNHPNIITLHDFAQEAGADYLVMEYVPGKSLDKLITPRGLPPIEAIGYATQIASALTAAHAAGIAHCDIKPANVMVTAESGVKILDFGLAKLVERASEGEGETQTLESTLTEAGMVMGTVAYMSPEQASGRALDHRTDIFSLGVVLYEMLTGARPFDRGSRAETMTAIINDPLPPLSEQPPELEEVLAKALAKDVKDRYQHCGDLGLDLRRFQRAWEAKSLSSMRGVRPADSRRRAGWPIATAVLALAVATVWWQGHHELPALIENPLAHARFTRLTDFPGDETDATISSDGRFVAFLSDRDGPFDVWLSQVGTGRFINLTQGKEDADLRSTARAIGFSGDGSEIWYRGTGPKRRPRLVPLMGGAPRLFLNDSVQYMAWSSDGTRLVYHTDESGDPIFVADRTGANARQIFKGEHNHDQAWSPDGDWIYFARGLGQPPSDLWRISPSGGEPERLTHHDTRVDFPTPIDSRTVLYTAKERDGSGPWLWMLDVRRKTSYRISVGLEQYTSVAASADGRRVVASVANPTATLWTVPFLDHIAEERDAKPFALSTVRALTPRFGGNFLFYLSSRGTGDGLWRYQGGNAQEIWKGADGALSDPPAVSADGSHVAIVLRSQAALRVNVGTADGTEFHTIGDTINVLGSAGWSPDGKWIAVGGSDADGPGLFKIPMDGSAPVRLATGSSRDPIWSPDGRLIVYIGQFVSTAMPLLAIRPDGTKVEFPEIKVRTRGERARFLPNGKGLIYMQGSAPWQDFWLLDLATGKTRQITRLSSTAMMRTFDITPDGKQIVFDRQRENSDIVLIDLPRGVSTR
jgi:Tol biopolymer transport system component/tRNA A-37 threonylcarbamoyl transferase component Bud32